MNFLELVKSRRSVRHYTTQPVEPEKLDYLMACARLAPSACNRQPWQLKIVTSPERLERLCEAAARFTWLKEAPLIIAITVDDSAAWTRSADGHNHSDVDAAILTEHIALAAAEQGLGSCWICAFDPVKCREALDLESHLRPVVLLPVGYPAESPEERPRKALNEIINHL